MLLTRNCWYLSQASTSADEIGSHHPILSAIPIFPKIIKIQVIKDYTLAGNLPCEEHHIQTTAADQAQEEHPGHQTSDLYHPYIVK
jgi:hypothetical protein